mgnify:CR=1 FL=1
MILLSRIKGLITSPQARAPRIAVFGDSHSVALLRAQQYSKRTHEYEHIRVSRLRKDKNGKAVGDISLADFCRDIREFAESDFVFSAVGGNQYAIVSTVRPAIDYDFMLSPVDQLNDGAQLVPFRALAAFIDSGIRETVGPVLREIRSSTAATVIHLAPPPPKQDNEFVAAHSEGYFAREGLQDFGPTRPELRLKCWNVQLNCLRSLCNELGIGLALPPRKTVTPHGYLDPGCYAKDVTHANRRYGEAVLRQILSLTGAASHGKVKSR